MFHCFDASYYTPSIEFSAENFQTDFKMDFIGFSSRGGQKSESDFLVSAWDFANNIAAHVNCPKRFPLDINNRNQTLHDVRYPFEEFSC